MKTLVSVLLSAIFTISVSAQRKSPLTREQLNIALVNAKIIKRTGAVITISGLVLDVTGIALLATSPVNGQKQSVITYRYRDTYAWRGGNVLLAGLGLTVGGIPVWVIGGVKKIHADNKLANLKVTSSINGVGLKIIF